MFLIGFLSNEPQKATKYNINIKVELREDNGVLKHYGV